MIGLKLLKYLVEGSETMTGKIRITKDVDADYVTKTDDFDVYVNIEEMIALTFQLDDKGKK